MQLVGVNVVFYLGQSLAGPWMAVMKAVGEVKYVFWISVAGMAANLVVSYILGIAAGFGLIGIWMGYLSDFAIKTVCCEIRFRKGAWKNLRIV